MHESRNIICEFAVQRWDFERQDGSLLFHCWIVNVEIKTTPSKSVTQFSCPVGGQNSDRPMSCPNCSHFRYGDLILGEKLEQECLEFLIRSIYFVNYGYVLTSRSTATDGVDWEVN